MFRSSKTLLLLLICLFFCQSAHANYLMGAEISWESIGKDSVKITVSAYRNCNSKNLSGGGIEIWPTNNPGKVKQIGGNLGPALDITPVCKTVASRCVQLSSSFAYGYEVNQITSIVRLDSTVCDWTVSWKQSVRSYTITTGGASTYFYTEANFNTCVGQVSNSPRFRSFPVMIVQKNLCQTLDFGATDIDRDDFGKPDSLVYKFAAPLVSSGVTMPYDSGYAKNYPVRYSGNLNDDFASGCKGFHINKNTGEVSFKPTKAEVSVMAVAVEEWRKDTSGKAVKVGETTREIQIIVIDLPSNAEPVISTPESESEFGFCLGQEYCITVGGQDPDGTEVKLSWKGNLPGAKITIADTSKKKPKVKICWKPEAKDTAETYTLTFFAQDGACPLPARQMKTLRFKTVHEPKPGIRATVSCGIVKLEAEDLAGNPDNKMLYTWTGAIPKVFDDTKDTMVLAGPTVYQPYSGTGMFRYRLSAKLRLTGCETAIEDSIYVPNFIRVNLPKDTFVCQDYAHTVKAEAMGTYGIAGYKWFVRGKNTDWKAIDSGAQKNTLTYMPMLDSMLKVVVTDSSGCSAADSMVVKVRSRPVINLGKDIVVCKSNFKVYLYSGNHYATHRWSHTIDTSAYIQVTQPGTYIAYVSYGSCEYSDTINIIYFNERPNLGPDRMICDGDSAILDAGASIGITRWGHTSDTGRFMTVRKAGKYIAYFSCGYTDTVNIAINAVKPKLGPDQMIGPDDTITLDAGYPGGTHRWLNASGDTGRFLTVFEPGIYIAEVRHDGCVGYDTVRVTAKNLSRMLGPDRILCPGDSITLDAGYPGGMHRWLNASGDTGRYLTVSKPGNYIVEVRYGVFTGYDTVSVTLGTPARPNLGPDAIICDHCIMNLFPGNFSTYLWSTGETSQRISVADSGIYWVSVVNESGCTGSDTITIVRSKSASIHTQSRQPASISIQPNPFGQSTSIVLNSTTAGPIQLEVFDVLGRKVRTVGEGVYSAGEHRFTFDAAGETGSIFLLRATVNGYVQTFRMVRY